MNFGAYVANGTLNFSPNTGASLSLPGSHVFENYTSVTIEVWVTTVASQQFPRLLQFGELKDQQYSVKVNTGYYCKAS